MYVTTTTVYPESMTLEHHRHETAVSARVSVARVETAPGASRWELMGIDRVEVIEDGRRQLVPLGELPEEAVEELFAKALEWAQEQGG